MIIITYTCDKCGHSQHNEDQMWNVGIAIDHRGYDGYRGSDWQSKKFQAQQLWCRKCIENIGLVTPKPQPKEYVAPNLTFEDMLRAIVREEVEATKQ